MSSIHVSITNGAPNRPLRVIIIRNNDGQAEISDLDRLLFTEGPGGTNELRAKLRQAGIRQTDIDAVMAEIIGIWADGNFEKTFEVE